MLVHSSPTLAGLVTVCDFCDALWGLSVLGVHS